MVYAEAQRIEVCLDHGGYWEPYGRLRAARIAEGLWPEIPTAEVEVVLGAGHGDPEIRMEAGLDVAQDGQRILIKEAGDEGRCLFVGRVTGRVANWGPGEEAVRLVAKHEGLDLQETVILGAWGLGYDGEEAHFPGWPPIANPGGRPNAGPRRSGAPLVRRFAPEDGPDSVLWTAKELLGYLLWRAQIDAWNYLTWLPWSVWQALGPDDLIDVPRDFDLDGKTYWEAIGALLEWAGWRCRLATTGVGYGPEPALVFHEAGAGAQKSVRLGAAGEALGEEDSAQQGLINFDTSGTVTVPRVWGGPLLVEGTWPLEPAWKTADLDPDARPEEGDDPEEDPALWGETYYARYVADPRAADFARYQDVGRKWALNEAGDYGAEYGEPAPFVFSEAVPAGLWAPRRRRFLRPLSWDGLKRHAPLRIEISFDGGAAWHDLPDAVVLEGECGVRISARDLARVRVPEESGSDAENLWEALCEAGGDPAYMPRVRVTASVADDSAVEPAPALSVPAWSPLARAVQWPYDRRPRYFRRLRLETGAYQSRWHADGIYPAADAGDDTEDLTAEAAEVQALTAGRQARGTIVLPDVVWDYVPGDVLTEIAGREISLALDGRTPPGYPEIIEVTRLWGPAAYATELVVEDRRVRSLR